MGGILYCLVTLNDHDDSEFLAIVKIGGDDVKLIAVEDEAEAGEEMMKHIGDRSGLTS